MANAKCKYRTGENNFFLFFFNFSQTITQSFITRFTGMPNVVQDGECVNPVKLIKRKIRVLKYLFCYVPNSALRGVKCCNLTSLP